MSRSKLLFAISAFLLSFGQVFAESANGPTGIWLTQAGDAKIRISHCGAGICGNHCLVEGPDRSSDWKTSGR